MAQDSQVLVEPHTCYHPFSTVTGSRHYLWRGWGLGQEATTIGMYESQTEQWTLQSTTGSPPRALYDGACASLGNRLYCFGGSDWDCPFNDLFELNTGNFQWSEIHPRNDSAEWPFCKQSCGLIAVDKNTVGCFGGYGLGVQQPGRRSSFAPCDSNAAYGWTNEFHLFDIQEGIWSSPQLKGQRPPPCCSFSFTKVNQDKAVLFGGFEPASGLGLRAVDSVYLFNLRNLEVTKVELEHGDQWPVRRGGHAACCLNYGEDHPQLLVSGGVNEACKRNVLGDMWILNVESGKWREVPLPKSVQSHCYHSITATSLRLGLTEVLMFGGHHILEGKPLAETTILRFERSISASGPLTEIWSLVDVAHNNTRGSSQRLREKKQVAHPTPTRKRSSTTSLCSSRDRVLKQQLQAIGQRVPDAEQREQVTQCCHGDTEQTTLERLHQDQDTQHQTEEPMYQNWHFQNLPKEKLHQEQDIQHQLEEAMSQKQDVQHQLDDVLCQKRDVEHQLEEALGQKQDLQHLLEEALRQEQEVQHQLAEALHQKQAIQYQLTGAQLELLHQKQNMETQIGRALRQKQAVEHQLKEALQREQAIQHELKGKTKELAAHKSKAWRIPASKVSSRGLQIGSGGWGSVLEGRLSVAMKQLHMAIFNKRNFERFQREMRLLAEVQHPNLIQFIGVVLEVSPPLLITELLDMNLRQAYEQNELRPGDRLSIFTDVAKALDYLHQRYEPIIHRDVSTPNVLLQRMPDNQWKGKVSDLGSANFLQNAQTMGEGAIVYSPPEVIPQAFDDSDDDTDPPSQTVKIDVYSYGILMCEVTASRFPSQDKYKEIFRQVHRDHPLLYKLIMHCKSKEPSDRPSMAEVLVELLKLSPF